MKTCPKPALLLASIFAVGVSAVASQANAGIISSFNGSGTSAGVAVSATATFDVSAGNIIITLSNTTIHTADAAQLLTGLRFTMDNDSTAITTATLTSKTGVERNVAGAGTFTDTGAPVDISWHLSSGSTFQLDFTPDAKDAIIGPADGSGLYTGNGSINGNAGHNPFDAQTATFVITNANILPTTNIDNVVFLYNTGLSQTIPGTEDHGGGRTPEPASLGVLGLGAVGLLARKRKA